VQHGPTTDIEGRLVDTAEPTSPAAGQHDRREPVHVSDRTQRRRPVSPPIMQLWSISGPPGQQQLQSRRLDRPTIAAMGRVTGRRPVARVRLAGPAPPAEGAATTTRADVEVVRRPDTLAVEEPLEVRVAGDPLAVTMRTPGDDIDLVHGFLLTEGVITSAAEVALARYCAGTNDDGRNTYNVIDVALAVGVSPPGAGVRRALTTTSSCGTCGKASIDAVRTRSAYPPRDDGVTVTAEVLATLPDTLRAAQAVFDRTGGLHAAGLFTPAGTLRCVREDVGRHNAVDKVIGHAARAEWLPLRQHVLMVSGRLSFELTQKAAMAGIPILAAVSAPSTLAVDLATELGMTLVGFLRGGTMNVYAGAQRLGL